MRGFPRQDLEQRLECAVAKVQPISGGDICEAFLVELGDGSRLFVKTRLGAPTEMFPTEGRGLEWLAETKTLRLPKVVAAHRCFLALEYLESGRRVAGFEDQLGRGLAALHKYPAEAPGWDQDNFIGPLPQPNETCESWVEFLIERRLKPRLQEAVQMGKAPSRWADRFQRLFAQLPTIIPEEPLSRLHGDLWGGNLHVGPQGEPCLIDPAVYVGHREVDLAMMKLFGGFSARVFDSYREAYPLVEGFERRVHLYQLYPLLVHVNLFGAGYVGSVERALDQLV